MLTAFILTPSEYSSLRRPQVSLFKLISFLFYNTDIWSTLNSLSSIFKNLYLVEVVAELEMGWDRGYFFQQSQPFHEKGVNEVVYLHFFLDFLPTSPSLPNHESNVLIIYYKKRYIITYGLAA